MEIWKPIKDYEKLYEISNYGNVKSILFRNNIIQKEQNKILKQNTNDFGYLVVQLRKDGKKKSYYVHRLVAEAFIENPNNFTEINHKDFDKTNNKAENLEWCSRKYNVNYSIKFMRKPKTKCKQTNTGEKYIRQRYGKYQLYIRNLTIFQSFENLQDAVQMRNEILKGGG